VATLAAGDYLAEKKYIQEAIKSGTTQFARNNAFVQTLLNAAKNMPDIEAFVQETDLRSRLY
jgi:hypothetical protein